MVAGAFGTSAAADTVDPAAFVSVFAKRQTVRRFKPDPVPDEHVRQILDAARRGPTTMNQQPWVFLVVRNPAKIEAMRSGMLGGLANQAKAFADANPKASQDEIAAQMAKTKRFFEGYFTASLYVAVLVDKDLPGSGYSVRHDGPIAAAYLMLAARAFGYGTAYLTDGISDEVTRAALNIPPKFHRVCITPIGVPERWPDPAPKRPLEAMIAYDTLDGFRPAERLPYNPI
jgi:nitroreductase